MRLDVVARRKVLVPTQSQAPGVEPVASQFIKLCYNNNSVKLSDHIALYHTDK